MTKMQLIHKDRVDNGVAFLDSHYPEWHKVIDLSSLSMGSPAHCVLGQVVGGADAYHAVLDDFDSDFEYEFGFYPDMPDGSKLHEDWAGLQDEWVKRIKVLLAS